ncbi:MAG: AGE family epimerase/isomerase [Candidatus Nealsonbacteria bacterium]|nr:AGE family epimerase/isomerase [Candidatus Nealsonbacteria bacterium]
MPFTTNEIDRLTRVYRDGLLDDTLPFWIDHCVDRQHGGFLFSLGRDGSVIDTDKPMWIHGRFTWLLATLYREVEPNEQWLDLARHGVEFINRHGFDADGRMFFLVDRQGRPLRKRRYLFTETFAVIALAAYSMATDEPQYARQALDLFRLIIRYHTTPGLLEPKTIPATRQLKGLGMPMILIATAQVLREAVREVRRPEVEEPICNEWIDRSIDEIERDFMNREFEAVLESVGPDGEFSDTFAGRMLCPGHALEAAWFILQEARHRGGDRRLIELGCTILDWSWQRGWDDQYGGIIYYRDVRGLPCTEYWHDMKFWWPQNEALIATLLAYRLTGNEKYADWHRRAHDWAYAHFPDPQHGEWYGYLHRDGRLSTSLKGNHFKGPFHLPRMQLLCWQLLGELRDAAPKEP